MSHPGRRQRLLSQLPLPRRPRSTCSRRATLRSRPAAVLEARAEAPRHLLRRRVSAPRRRPGASPGASGASPGLQWQGRLGQRRPGELTAHALWAGVGPPAVPQAGRAWVVLRKLSFHVTSPLSTRAAFPSVQSGVLMQNPRRGRGPAGGMHCPLQLLPGPRPGLRLRCPAALSPQGRGQHTEPAFLPSATRSCSSPSWTGGRSPKSVPKPSPRPDTRQVLWFHGGAVTGAVADGPRVAPVATRVQSSSPVAGLHGQHGPSLPWHSTSPGSPAGPWHGQPPGRW